jgi:anti-sigma B factor antagonist
VPDEGGVRVRPFGSLDMATAPELDAKLTDLCATGHDLILVDLGGLDFMDSSGLRLLLSWDSFARRDGISVQLVPGSPTVQRVFEVTGTAGVFTFRQE